MAPAMNMNMFAGLNPEDLALLKSMQPAAPKAPSGVTEYKVPGTWYRPVSTCFFPSAVRMLYIFAVCG